MRLLVFALLLAAAYAKHEEYKGWKSFIIEPTTQEQLAAVRSLQKTLEVVFISHPIVSREGLVIVKSQYIDTVSRALQNIGVRYWIHSDDVKASLELQDAQIEARRNFVARAGGRQLPCDNYQTIDEIEAYIDDVARRHPDVATLVEPALSFEGRPLKYLKISTTNFQDPSKPVIIIDGGMHAREWATISTVMWAAHKLVEDVTEPDLLEKFDWILMPVVNPDGYKYSYETVNLWRKTRSIATSDQHSSECRGVDGNRNYDFHWNTVGVGHSPCADDYAGPRAFSEPETHAVRDIIMENRDRAALYLTMHSYGGVILYPWGHDGSDSSNVEALHTVGLAMAEAINAVTHPSLQNYTVGNAAQMMYGVSGAAEDYAHSVGVPLAYCYELPWYSGSLDGLQIPPAVLGEVCRETWLGITAGARLAGEMFRGPIEH